MSVQTFLHTIDGISTWVGKTFAWLIIVLMTVVCVEVFKRYILNAPTAWIFDLDAMLYGTLFMMCGAYTLAQNGHVRGDFLYVNMKPRTQAWRLWAHQSGGFLADALDDEPPGPDPAVKLQAPTAVM